MQHKCLKNSSSDDKQYILLYASHFTYISNSYNSGNGHLYAYYTNVETKFKGDLIIWEPMNV